MYAGVLLADIRDQIIPMTVEQEIFRILNKYRRGGHWAYEPDRV